MAGTVSAQSGRRAPKQSSEPPVPVPTPEAKAVKIVPATEKIQVLVVAYSPASMSVSIGDIDVLMDTLIHRLRDANALSVSAGDKMSRDHARKRAQSEENRYVIWIELQANGLDTDPIGGSRRSGENYHIQYVVFAPRTGQTKTNGNIYLRPDTISGGIGGGRSRTPACYPPAYGFDYSLMLGAFETADRIIQSFDLAVPPVCP